ncbi:MAG: ABC transporter permease subunit [Candidatus Eisenbacteria bacterium]|nr:ABC transporter permease subunit [Candidatus Eisenbacteria bacterium]
MVASKNFEESRLLAELFARVIETRTNLTVERRMNLAGTQVCLDALRSGAIDLYPEYTGTGLVSILGQPSRTDRAEVLSVVRGEFLQRWDLVWLAPLGFENSFELAVRREVADRLAITSISGLAAHAGELRAGFGPEFIERDDGYPGLGRVYGLHFSEARSLQHALKYEAAGTGKVDVIDVYTTDGRIAKYDLRVLNDDRSFFPPYEAAPLVRASTLNAHPEVGAALNLLTGVLDEESMRGWNLRLQEEGASVEEVAAAALQALGLSDATRAPIRSTRPTSLFAYLWAERGDLLRRIGEHLGMVIISLILAILVAVPLGVGLERRRAWADWVIRSTGVLQTIPSIALLAFMIPVLGVGAAPAIAALFLYSLYPIIQSSYTGVREVDPAAVDAAWALGMTRGQILRRIRLPLALPIIVSGIRTAAVINVGTATLAAFIGAGGLGEPIVSGLQMSNTIVILSGALPAALLALMVDTLLGICARALRPAGLESTEAR